MRLTGQGVGGGGWNGYPCAIAVMAYASQQTSGATGVEFTGSILVAGTQRHGQLHTNGDDTNRPYKQLKSRQF
jgi:hypothetical protein